MILRNGKLGIWLLSFLLLTGCPSPEPEPVTQKEQVPKKIIANFKIISGSENKALEPLIQEFARRKGTQIMVDYKGSVDIMLELKENRIGYDAVWPANSLWIKLGDQRKRVRHVKSIMRSPVVFGIKKAIAERLGWTGRSVEVKDLLGAADEGGLHFTMTSATQSNSGASAYLGFLHAMAGSPDVVTREHLEDPSVQDKVRRLLKAVDRSSGSSGWLKDMMVDRYAFFDAMVNYEAMVIEANKELVRQGKDPLYAIYPVDGLMVADMPLGFVNKGDADREAFFLELQEYLLSAPVRTRIEQLGRRAGMVGLSVEHPDPAVFNPAWGIDAERVISTVPLPEADVIERALDTYQVSLRKPSLTVYVLDYSGSMAGEGERQLEEAMQTLLLPEIARQYMLQSSANDIHIVIPFNHQPMKTLVAQGNGEEDLRDLYHRIRLQEPGGGTNIYKGTLRGFRELEKYEERMHEFFPAIILMSDGKSKGSLAELEEKLDQISFGRDVPVFSITFGDADKTQLEEISQLLAGRVFDGHKNLVQTFRKAKGYN